MINITIARRADFVVSASRRGTLSRNAADLLCGCRNVGRDHERDEKKSNCEVFEYLLSHVFK